jgi:hypothetical protein
MEGLRSPAPIKHTRIPKAAAFVLHGFEGNTRTGKNIE